VCSDTLLAVLLGWFLSFPSRWQQQYVNALWWNEKIVENGNENQELSQFIVFLA